MTACCFSFTLFSCSSSRFLKGEEVRFSADSVFLFRCLNTGILGRREIFSKIFGADLRPRYSSTAGKTASFDCSGYFVTIAFNFVAAVFVLVTFGNFIGATRAKLGNSLLPNLALVDNLLTDLQCLSFISEQSCIKGFIIKNKLIYWVQTRASKPIDCFVNVCSKIIDSCKNTCLFKKLNSTPLMQ